MEHRLFDLHCDTPYRMLKEKQPLKSNSLHVALDKTSAFSKYAQIAAIWSDKNLTDDEAYTTFWRILNNFKSEIEANRGKAAICRSYEEFSQLPDQFAAFFLAIEDARILSSNIERIYEVYDAGVRFISMNWKGDNSLGGGYDTNSPLTYLGRTVAGLALDLGMVLDVSHSSARVFDELAEMAESAKCPLIATHSNSNSVAVHPRNMTDEQFTKISKTGGIVGISLAHDHLCGHGNVPANINDIIEHIEYYLGLNGQHTVCLGCDFDGIDTMPDKINNVGDLYNLAEALSARNFSDELINAIFYQNAHNFLKKTLTQL